MGTGIFILSIVCLIQRIQMKPWLYKLFDIGGSSGVDQCNNSDNKCPSDETCMYLTYSNPNLA